MLILVSLVAVSLFGILIASLSRYRRCPSDKVLVIYGKTGRDKDGQARAARCVHGGAAFVWPLLQAYQYMDLMPIAIDIDLRSALSKQNIRMNIPSVFTVGISTEDGVMQNAAERLLGLQHTLIKTIAEDIIFGQLRLTIAMMDIEEINADRDKFLLNVSDNVETELKKVGLRLINVNIKDLTSRDTSRRSGRKRRRTRSTRRRRRSPRRTATARSAKRWPRRSSASRCPRRTRRRWKAKTRRRFRSRTAARPAR
jgi:flotillin